MESVVVVVDGVNISGEILDRAGQGASVVVVAFTCCIIVRSALSCNSEATFGLSGVLEKANTVGRVLLLLLSSYGRCSALLEQNSIDVQCIRIMALQKFFGFD